MKEIVNSFSYQKKEEASFVKMEDNLGQIKLPYMDGASIDIVDDIQTGYGDPRWIEKSNSIKARDNYTCQLCHAFNPMQNTLLFVRQGKYETYHQYIADRSSYIIHVKEYELTINIDLYSGFHLAMPRLNVHHKVYFRNRMLWDYPDDCLVTLCENCHHYIHSLSDIGIPIIEDNPAGQAILIGKTQPKQYQPRLDHTDLSTFHPFALVKEERWGVELRGQDKEDFERAMAENTKWYNYYETFDNHVAHISYFKSYDPRRNKHTPEEIKKVVDFIIFDFIEHILGFSKKE